MKIPVIETVHERERESVDLIKSDRSWRIVIAIIVDVVYVNYFISLNSLYLLNVGVYDIYNYPIGAKRLY
jgi:hypothetical protein